MLAGTLILLVPACSKATAEEIVAQASTFAEQSAVGTLHWNVGQDGETKLVVKNPSGAIAKGNVTGQLTFNGKDGQRTKTVPLAMDEKTGVLKADGPPLDDEVTEVRYALLVDGKPWTGTLHVPKSGTQGLVKSATESDSSRQAGPHGGDVQLIGEQRYEVVADSKSGQVRVYLVDAASPKPKTIKLAVDSDPPRQVELVYDDDGYYVAEVDSQRLPRKLTLVVVDPGERTHVVLVGYHPGVIYVVDRRPVFWIDRGWEHPGLARGHYKGTPMGPPGQSRIVIVDDHGKHGHLKIKGR